MALEAMREIQAAEAAAQERKSAAQLESHRLTMEAQQKGEALVSQNRFAGAEQGKEWMRQAEEEAAKEAAEIQHDAGKMCAAIRKTAEAHLEETADLIVERVVRR